MSVWKNRKTWRWRVQRDGIERSGSARTRQEATDAEAQAKAELAAGITGHIATRHTLDAALSRYLTSPEFLRLKSAIKQASVADKWIPFFRGRLLHQAVDVADEAIGQWHRAGLKPATINRRLAILRRVLNIAYRRWVWIDRPIADRISLLPGEESREIYITRAEAVRLRRAAKPGAPRAWISLLVYTGLRASELERLRADQVQDGIIYLDARTKTGKPRAVPILSPGQRYIRHIPLQLGQQGLRPYWYAARAAIGRPDLHLHDLRHACASWLAQSGATTRDLQVWLGHTNPATTARYAHLDVSRLLAVARAATPEKTRLRANCAQTTTEEQQTIESKQLSKSKQRT